MSKINKLTISPQVINTLQQSNDPWGIKDSSSCFIYSNSVTENVFIMYCQ